LFQLGKDVLEGHACVQQIRKYDIADDFRFFAVRECWETNGFRRMATNANVRFSVTILKSVRDSTNRIEHGRLPRQRNNDIIETAQQAICSKVTVAKFLEVFC
jgi:hypothetical protein